MSEERETTPFDEACPVCGAPLEQENMICAHCDFMQRVEPNITPANILPRNPSLWPKNASDFTCFDETTLVIFQFLPSGTCLPYTLEKPLVVGRRMLPDRDDFLDLSTFHADRHGISRQHCRFWRRAGCLLLADLGSTNGTYFNGERVTPFYPYTVHHDARLILGSLHVVVTFA